jgi:hypothetical protein
MVDHPGGGTGAPRAWSEPELESALRDLGSRLAYPATPDLARSVRRHLATEPARPERVGSVASLRTAIAAWLAGLTPRRAVAVAVLAVVLAGAALLALVPTARDTVAGWFGVRGIRIVFVDETPTPTPAATATAPPATPAASATPPSLGVGLLLGERVTLAEAQTRVDFPIRVPDAALLGPPDEVYVRALSDGDMVSFVYYPRPELPAAAETGVGLLLVQFEAPEDSFWGEKTIGPANEVRPVRVDGGEGLWIEGWHLLFVAPDPLAGAVREGIVERPAANVLLWDEDGVTYRLESDLSAPETIAVAESLVPMATPEAPTPVP